MGETVGRHHLVRLLGEFRIIRCIRRGKGRTDGFRKTIQEDLALKGFFRVTGEFLNVHEDAGRFLVKDGILVGSEFNELLSLIHI